MRLVGSGSALSPVKAVLGGLLVIVGVLVMVQALAVAVLLVNPVHPIGAYFQVTTLARVPPDVWPPDSLVRVAPGSATATVDPWAYITFRPSSRAFVFVAAIASYSWWACVVLVLLQMRRAVANMSAGTPFPRENIRCIRLVGWAILGMAATSLLIDVGMLAYMRAAVTVADRPPVIPAAMMVVDFPLGTILAGAAVVILAEIFRAGSDLQDEQALTI